MRISDWSSDVCSSDLSQGSLHLIRLLHEKVAGTPLASRIVAAYVVGWPISVESDLPALGLPACQKKDQAGCILSWQSFAEPADPASIQPVFDESTGLTGKQIGRASWRERVGPYV